MVAVSFQPELARLVDAATPLLADDPPPRSAIEAALTALLAAFPVYRLYVATLPADAADAELWAEGAGGWPSMRPQSEAIGVRLQRARRSPCPAPRQIASAACSSSFRARPWPRAVEDTELYRSVALTSVNEVGSGSRRVRRLISRTCMRASPPSERAG